jgi:hypothetical protein
VVRTDPRFGGPPDPRFRTLRTGDGVLSAALPTAWADAELQNPPGGTGLAAAPDLQAFARDPTVPGVPVVLGPSQGV